MTNLNKYETIEQLYFKAIERYFSNRLLFYCITGSTARSQNVNNWSDIDIIMVFDDLKIDDLIIINNEILNLSSDIKIGTTSYSKEDIRLKLIDAKTANMIRNLRVNKYKPKIDILDIKNYLDIDDDFVLEINKMEFSKDMHVFRREIMKLKNLDERKVYKTLTYLMRVLIFNSGYIVDGYFETWSKVKYLGWDTGDNILYPSDIIDNNINLDSRLDIYNFWYKFIQNKSKEIFSLNVKDKTLLSTKDL